FSNLLSFDTVKHLHQLLFDLVRLQCPGELALYVYDVSGSVPMINYKVANVAGDVYAVDAYLELYLPFELLDFPGLQSQFERPVIIGFFGRMEVNAVNPSAFR